jgi:hypothetical protein
LTSISIIAIYCIIFFFYPTKASFLIIVIPFSILLASSLESYYLYALVIINIVSCFLAVDMFKDRTFVGPVLKKGYYLTLLSAKPKNKCKGIEALLIKKFEGKNIIITNYYPWDFEYFIEIRRKNNSSDYKIDNRYGYPVIFHKNGVETMFYPRTLIGKKNTIKKYQQNGYKIWMDKNYFREIFFKYNVFKKLPNKEEVDGVVYYLFNS